MKQLFLDANVILRYLLTDNEQMTPAAASLFEQAENGEVQLVLHPIIVAECCYVLHGPVYRIERTKIADVLTQLTLMDGVMSDEPIQIAEALNLYATRNVDFADAFLAASAKAKGFGVATFDQDFHGLGAPIYVPGE